MKKTLAAGPWIGEFGYELFEWQGAVRNIAIKDGFEKVVIAGRSGHEAIYEDFCTQYIPFDRDINPCEGRFSEVDCDLEALTTQVFAGIPYSRAVCPLERHKEVPQSFTEYGVRKPDIGYDVVFHARNIQVENPDGMVDDHAMWKQSRNWIPEKWEQLAAQVLDAGYRIACIGISSAALSVSGCDDKRNLPLGALADVLASSSLVVGPSSGPMHFATLCGCNQLVWGYPHLKLRYEKLWNPYNTGVYFLETGDSFDVNKNAVYDMIVSALTRA